MFFYFTSAAQNLAYLASSPFQCFLCVRMLFHQVKLNFIADYGRQPNEYSWVIVKSEKQGGGDLVPEHGYPIPLVRVEDDAGRH